MSYSKTEYEASWLADTYVMYIFFLLKSLDGSAGLYSAIFNK